MFLPKFKTTAEFGLADTLKAMGMASAFDRSTADFSGMTGRKELYFSAVIHKAFVDVNEEGTEAAAATGIIMMRSSAIAKPRKPAIFRADHPFVFLIRDNRNGAILFLGQSHRSDSGKATLTVRRAEMQRKVAILAVISVALGLCAFTAKLSSMPIATHAEINPKVAEVSVAAVVESGNRFAFDLYERLRSTNGNLFFSPAGISLALAMGYAGASEKHRRGRNGQNAPSGDAKGPKVNEEMRALLASWKATDKKQGFRLDVANRLWGQEGYKFLPEYLQVTRDDFGAELAPTRLSPARGGPPGDQSTGSRSRRKTKSKNLIASRPTP